MTAPARLQKWLSGGLRTVMLPTGTIFAFRIPDVEDLVQRGLVPEDLRAAALKFAAQTETGTLDTDELAKMLKFFRGMVAQMLRYIWEGPEEPIEAWIQFDPNDDHWKPVSLTQADFEEVMIEGDDYAALQAIVQRKLTAKGVTAISLRDRGLIRLEEFDKLIAGETTQRIGSWESFRFESGRAEPGADGGHVAPEAVDDGGDQRPANRADRRRSARHQARAVPRGAGASGEESV